MSWLVLALVGSLGLNCWLGLRLRSWRRRREEWGRLPVEAWARLQHENEQEARRQAGLE